MGDAEITTMISECFKALEDVALEDGGNKGGKLEEVSGGSGGSINLLFEEEADAGFIGAVERVRIRPAMDSGSTAHVLHPDDLPDNVEIKPNVTGKHFKGANDSVIENYGTCETVLESDLGKVGCSWTLAGVPRSLRSVSAVAGPAGGPSKAKQDVLFNNDLCVVVPPGIVNEILKRVKPVARYDREGNLYAGEMTMSSFPRQGQGS